jgi:hypothetical protein
MCSQPHFNLALDGKTGNEMSDTAQGQGWWLASDGKWYPPESAKPPPPPPPPPPAPAPHVALEPTGHGALILNRMLAIVGVLTAIVGAFFWFDGSSSNQSCQAVNNFLAGTGAGTNCSSSQTHIGEILLLVGLGLIVLAIILRIVRGTTTTASREEMSE